MIRGATLVILCAATAWAADVDGRWQLTYTTGNGLQREAMLELKTVDELAQKLGARAMPIPMKRKLAAAGNAMEAELAALTEYMAAMDESLGKAAEVSGAKMLYQMNRLRRMAATHELQKENSLKKHATAMALNLFPDGHPQERLLAGAWFLARHGEGLAGRLVTEADSLCPGHIVIRL